MVGFSGLSKYFRLVVVLATLAIVCDIFLMSGPYYFTNQCISNRKDVNGIVNIWYYKNVYNSGPYNPMGSSDSDPYDCSRQQAVYALAVLGFLSIVLSWLLSVVVCVFELQSRWSQKAVRILVCGFSFIAGRSAHYIGLTQ